MRVYICRASSGAYEQEQTRASAGFDRPGSKQQKHQRNEHRDNKKMNARNLFFFDDMLTPKFITLIYWIGLIAAVFAGVGSIFMMGFDYVTFGGFLKGLLITVLGAVAVRVWCELTMVLFKINENVKKIADSKP
jgi:small-conductance mechanosensitive channel